MLRKNAVSIYNKAIEAVKPAFLLSNNLVKSGDNIIICGENYSIKYRRLKIIAIGKAAAAMSSSAEEILGDILHSGICITKYGHQLPLSKIVLIESAHPIPDENSVIAADELLKFSKTCTENDLVLVLMSGGASSLVVDLPEGVSLIDIQMLYNNLVKSGADIGEINCVRKQLSSLKGGGLLDELSQAEVITLAISDVIGDNPSIIGSGLTVPNETTKVNAIYILQKYGLWEGLLETIRSHLLNGKNKTQPEVTKQIVNFHIIGSNHMALEAAKSKAESLGYRTEIVSENFNKNINELEKLVIHKILTYNNMGSICFLWGGEPTIEVSGEGKGGRNQHLVLKVLKALIELDNKSELIMLSIGTDGTDGPTDAAGAIIDNKTIEKLTDSKQDLTPYIEKFDAYHFFESIDGLIKTGPTQTNVMDVVIVLIHSK